MSIFAGYEQIVKRDEPLAGHTWYRLGGPARYFLTPRNEAELSGVVGRCREHSLPIHVLGGGANLLVGDEGVNGAVIRLEGDFARTQIDQNVVTAGAGADMSKLTLRCVREGLAGMECLTGVPGSIGGGVKMNAGGAFGDIGNMVESVDLMDSDGVGFTRLRGELVFGYRHTNISAKVILGAQFRLMPDDPRRILNQVKRIWIYKKNTQPLWVRSAGCIFKNPRGLSAGALIDKSGLKGRRTGGAQVSDRHANFIIADPGTRASDVLKLINIIREDVYKRWEVYLELEVEVW